MDIIQLYKDYSIPFVTEGHKHARDGWVNTICPFCTGNPGMHLGYNIESNHFVCWRCGGKQLNYALSKVLKLPDYDVSKLISQYGGRGQKSVIERKRKVRVLSHKLPSGTDVLLPQHIKYLTKRKYDVTSLVKDWGLLATGPISLLKMPQGKILDYSHRIIIPVYWDGEQVTYQGRDITNRHPLKYMACPEARELIHHKHIIYGKQEAWGDTGICCEGVTDVWRLGFNAFCTFGIKYTPKQVRVIAKTFKRVAVVFDDEPQAQEQAKKLISELRFRGVTAWNIVIKGDPGSMSQKDADKLVLKIMETT